MWLSAFSALIPTPTLQIQRNQMVVAALPNHPTKRRNVQIVQIVALQTQRLQLPELQLMRGTVFQKRTKRFPLDFVVYTIKTPPFSHSCNPDPSNCCGSNAS